MATTPIPPAPKPPPIPGGGTLYVILHGLCGILDTDTGIEILIPDVGPSHVYRVGEFLGEVTLQPSAAPYYLNNVEGGSAHFDPKLNLVADGVPAVAYAKLYARIRLPLPVKIYSVRPLDLSGIVLDPGGHFASKTATMVQVLEYVYQDFRKVMFGSQFVDIAPLLGKDGGMYMSLHVFTEEDQARPNDHTVSGFDAVAQLFNFNCPPVLTTPKQSPLMTALEVPVGLTLMEFLDLAPRTREVAFIGRKLRQDVLLGNQKPMVEGPNTGSDPATCLLMVSRIKGGSNA